MKRSRPRKSGAIKEIERLSTIEDLRRLMAHYVCIAEQQRCEDPASLLTANGTFAAANAVIARPSDRQMDSI